MAAETGMRTEITVNTQASLTAITIIRTGIKRGLSYVIADLSRIVEKYSKVALTEGDTRAIKTGLLRSTIHSTITALRGIIEPNTNYEYFVHEGTRFMRARPYMVRGVELGMPEMQRRAYQDIKDQL